MSKIKLQRMDFCLNKYRDLCRGISESKYRSATFRDFILNIDSIEIDDNIIILRHDVDRFPETALNLAKIENSFGLLACYYFRIPKSFNKKIIEEITSMGHEIGLHYECIDKASGNIEKAVNILRDDLKTLRSITTVDTVAMHGNPVTKWDNRDIWKYCSLSDFDLSGEVYISMDFEKALYYSDTGRNWDDNKFNIKDSIPKNMSYIAQKPEVKKTDDLIVLIQREKRNLYILTHPERWPGNIFLWFIMLCKDYIINYIKVFYKLISNR